MITLTELNQMSQELFVDNLGTIFEHTPHIAAKTWHDKPFCSFESLYESMVTVVDQMSDTEQLNLIKAHPDLATRAKMADASVKEQAGAGLNQLQPEEYQRFEQLNSAYREKFGFPFLIAVKNHTKASILDNFASRLKNNRNEEKKQALKEIKRIARFRLEHLLEKA
jgi:2-oxo-4-hydroxy-4-carboxy-5-ureidoimidazoline decarboxylase